MNIEEELCQCPPCQAARARPFVSANGLIGWSTRDLLFNGQPCRNKVKESGHCERCYPDSLIHGDYRCYGTPMDCDCHDQKSPRFAN